MTVPGRRRHLRLSTRLVFFDLPCPCRQCVIAVPVVDKSPVCSWNRLFALAWSRLRLQTLFTMVISTTLHFLKKTARPSSTTGRLRIKHSEQLQRRPAPRFTSELSPGPTSVEPEVPVGTRRLWTGACAVRGRGLDVPTYFARGQCPSAAMSFFWRLESRGA